MRRCRIINNWPVCAGGPVIPGERYVYKFVCDPEALFNMAYGNNGNDPVNSIPTSCRSSSISNFGAATVLNEGNMTQNFYN